MAKLIIQQERIVPGVLALLLALTLSLVATPTAALAHERRTVGKFQFIVGFLNEPAIQGEPNGVDLRITYADTGEPVLNAQQTLKVAVAYGGGLPKEFPLRARFGQPGAYAADFIPTREGQYRFIFTGTLDGQPINETFESGPGRFNDVEAASALQFPEVVPPAAEVQRQLREAQDAARAAQAAAAAAEMRGTYLGLGGIVLGAAGVVLGVAGLLGRRREPLARPSPARRTGGTA